MLLLSSETENDQLCIIRYVREGLKFMLESKYVDIQIGRISNLAIISRLNVEEDNVIQAVLVDYSGVTILLDIAPKTLRVVLPIRQTLYKAVEPLSHSHIAVIEDYLVVAALGAQNTTVLFIEKNSFSQIHRKSVVGHITSLTGYTYTDAYSMVLYTVANSSDAQKDFENKDTKYKLNLKGFHVTNPEEDYYMVENDEGIFLREFESSNIAFNQDTGSIMFLDQTSMKPLKVDNKCTLQIADPFEISSNEEDISKSCLKRTGNLFKARQTRKVKEDQYFILWISFLVVLLISAIALGIIYYIIRIYGQINNPEDPQRFESEVVGTKVVNVYVKNAKDISNPNEMCSICMCSLFVSEADQSEFNIDFIEKSSKDQKPLEPTQRAIKSGLNISMSGNTLDDLEHANQYADDENIQSYEISPNFEAQENEIVSTPASKTKAEVVTLYNCQHSYHKDCVEKWLRKSNSCPICRVDVWVDAE